MDGERFGESFSLTLGKKYDLSQISKVIVGGDGSGGLGAIEGNVDKLVACGMKKEV